MHDMLPLIQIGLYNYQMELSRILDVYNLYWITLQSEGGIIKCYLHFRVSSLCVSDDIETLCYDMQTQLSTQCFDSQLNPA